MTWIGLTPNRLSPRDAKPGSRSLLLVLFLAVQVIFTQPAIAQTRALTIRYATLSPFIALLAGILILVTPRLLNYIVAIYLILVGLMGVLGV